MRTPSPSSASPGPWVFVTGASSGIGRAMAEALCRGRYRVIATVRREEDIFILKKELGTAVFPLLLDVTDEAGRREAFASAQALVGAEGLYALMNNAGIGVAGPVECLPVDALRHQFEVDVFSQIALVQLLLPLLRLGRYARAGRIVNTCSISDYTTMPFFGALCAAKQALHGLGDALRQELHSSGIHVVALEPASIHTRSMEKVKESSGALLEALTPEQRQRYGGMLGRFIEKFGAMDGQGSPPSVVGETVRRILDAGHPRSRYITGRNGHVLAFFGRVLPDSVFDALKRRMFGLPNRFGGQSLRVPRG